MEMKMTTPSAPPKFLNIANIPDAVDSLFGGIVEVLIVRLATAMIPIPIPAHVNRRISRAVGVSLSSMPKDVKLAKVSK